jgi:NAD(P)-dependent dehydrogenase (short-subunit alcohol dehydrogenase family)
LRTAIIRQTRCGFAAFAAGAASGGAEVSRRSGRLDLLVNNAGFGLIAGAEESSIEQSKSIFEVSVFWVYADDEHVLPVMRQQRNGRVINISSVVGFLPAPYYAIYSATKHAIEGYSQTLELGVRVIASEPDPDSRYCCEPPGLQGPEWRVQDFSSVSSAVRPRGTMVGR